MTSPAGDKSWMLKMIMDVPYVRHAVVLSADGLPTVWTEDTPKEVADRLAAVCSALSSLGDAVSREFGAGGDLSKMRQVMVEYPAGFMFVRQAANGSRLAVVTTGKIDAGLLAQQMQAQILKLGEETLSTPARTS